MSSRAGHLHHPQPGWRDVVGADPLPWLLDSPEPAARWLATTRLLDLPPDDPQVRRAHEDVLADPGTRALVRRIPDWTVDQRLSGHESPGFAPHLLNLLGDMGVQAGEVDEVEALLDSMLAHHDDEGRFESFGTAARGQPPVWGALLCDSHALLEVLVRFGRYDDPRVRAGLERMAADLTETPQGRAWTCLPHTVTGWRGPGRRGDVCPMVTLQALRTWSWVPPGDRPAELEPATRVVLRAWTERATERPYQFGHGVRFKTVKWPPTWYSALAVVDTLGRFPQVWSDTASAQARALAEVTACLVAYNVSDGGTVVPRSVYRGFEDHSFGQKHRPSPFATALLLSAVRRVEALAPLVLEVDVSSLTSSKGGTGTPVAPRGA